MTARAVGVTGAGLTAATPRSAAAVGKSGGVGMETTGGGVTRGAGCDAVALPEVDPTPDVAAGVAAATAGTAAAAGDACCNGAADATRAGGELFSTPVRAPPGRVASAFGAEGFVDDADTRLRPEAWTGAVAPREPPSWPAAAVAAGAPAAVPAVLALPRCTTSFGVAVGRVLNSGPAGRPVLIGTLRWGSA